MTPPGATSRSSLESGHLPLLCQQEATSPQRCSFEIATPLVAGYALWLSSHPISGPWGFFEMYRESTSFQRKLVLLSQPFWFSSATSGNFFKTCRGARSNLLFGRAFSSENLAPGAEAGATTSLTSGGGANTGSQGSLHC